MTGATRRRLALLLGAVLLAGAAATAGAQDYQPLPNPVIALNGTEEYTPSGGPAIMYKLTVTNWSS